MKQRSGGGKRVALRTSQKQKLRYAVAGSVIALSAMLFIYINISQHETSNATEASAYKPTYRTTDVNVPVRLLLKPDAEMRMPANGYTPKTDSSVHTARFGRSMEIKNERYISE
jgi:hypothetical protein